MHLRLLLRIGPGSDAALAAYRATVAAYVAGDAARYAAGFAPTLRGFFGRREVARDTALAARRGGRSQPRPLAHAAQNGANMSARFVPSWYAVDFGRATRCAPPRVPNPPADPARSDRARPDDPPERAVLPGCEPLPFGLDAIRVDARGRHGSRAHRAPTADDAAAIRRVLGVAAPSKPAKGARPDRWVLQVAGEITLATKASRGTHEHGGRARPELGIENRMQRLITQQARR